MKHVLPQSRKRLVQALNMTREILKTSSGMHYALLAFKVGYSPEYFRRTILRLLQQLDGECVVVDSKGVVSYVCDHEDVVEREARREAEEFLRGVGVSG